MARDRRAHPRQRPRRRRLRRADRRARSRSRSSASRACSGCPRSPRSSPRSTLLHDVTANAALLTLLTGPRWAIGPRDLALLGRRAARARRAPRPRRDVRRRPTTELPRGRRRRRPGRDRLARRRARRPRATCAYSPEARERFALLAGELRLLRRARRRAAPRPGPPDHRHHRHRRRAGLLGQPGGRGPARQPRPVRQGGRGVPGRRRRRHAAGAARLPQAEDELRQRPRRRHARPRPTRSSCSPSTAPRAWSGTRCSWSASAETQVPDQPAAHAGPTVAGRAARAAARRRRATCRSCAGYDKPALDAYRPATPRRTRPSEELRLGYVAFTRAAPPAVGLVATSGARRQDRRSARRPTSVVRDRLEALAARRAPDAVAGQAGEGRRPTRYAAARPDAAVADARHRTAEVDAPARRRRAWCASRRRRRPTTTTDDMLERGPGRSEWDDELDRLLAEARARPRRRSSTCRCPRSLSATALARLRDDPDGVRRATWPGRCRASRRRRPGSAPASTPGSRRGSASRTCFDPDDLPGPRRRRHRRRRRPARADRRRSRTGRSPTGSRTPSRRRSRWCSPARWCAAGSTRSTPSRSTARRLPGRRLEDQPRARRRPAPARALPAGLGRARRVPLERVRAAFYYVRTGDGRRARRPARPRPSSSGLLAPR